MNHNEFHATPDKFNNAVSIDTVAERHGVALDVKAMAAIGKNFVTTRKGNDIVIWRRNRIEKA